MKNTGCYRTLLKNWISGLTEDTVEVVVQVNGKVRDKLLVAVGLPDDALLVLAQTSPKIQAHLDGKTLVKTIVVKNKLVSMVAT